MAPSGTVASMRTVFHAVTRACVPKAEDFTPAQWAAAESIVDDALALRPPGVRRQILLFARVLDVLAVLRYGRRLSDLDVRRARALLAALERAPLLPFRRGVWGLRTLAFMGVYAQRDVQREVGYAADAPGWTSRGGGMGPWTDRGGEAAPETGTLTAGGDGAVHHDPAGGEPPTGPSHG